MICTNPYPKRIPNPNWDGVNPLSEYTSVLLPCGKCLACRINRRREWTSRLMQEEIYSQSSTFITLSYTDEDLPRDDNDNPCPCVVDLQLYIKRLRKHFPQCKLRYMINSEYGPETLRPHYHGIIFNLPRIIYDDATQIVRFKNGRKSISYHSSFMDNVWSHGDVEFSPATKERCGYTAKYFVDRKEVPEPLSPNISICSRGGRGDSNLGGIGSRYAKDIKSKVLATGSISMFHPGTGYPVPLPRLYKNYIFSEEQRKEMTEKYYREYEVPQEVLTMLENHQMVEANQYKAIHYKRIKSKL